MNRRNQRKIHRYLEQIMTKLSELAATLNDVNANLNKAKGEILAKIDTLESSLTDVELPADAQAALDALKESAQALDGIVPDAPAVEEPAATA